MPEPLKNIYTSDFVNQLTSNWKRLLPNLNEKRFLERVVESDWNDLELKQRMSRLADVTILELPSDFSASALLLRKMIISLAEADLPVSGFEYMFIPEIALKLGLNDWREAMETIECITTYTSCEFAIRPFIVKYEAETMQQMLDWSTHSHPNVRRLSSEGCRSRLPWAMALPKFKKNASLIIPILENLKADDSLFVRKSVANNLNDISKDLPDLALKLAFDWHGNNEFSNWIVKHGMRTLLKAGNPKSMILFGYAKIEDLNISEIQLGKSEVDFGGNLKFTFSISNQSQTESLVRLEYFIYLLKQNGTQTKKIFKIAEKSLEPKETVSYSKSHPFKPINTRKYYYGEHGVALVVNGIEFEKHSFLLNM